MVTKFELFERQDIEKSQIIRRYSNIILEKIKNYLYEKIQNEEDIISKFKLTDTFFCVICGDKRLGGTYGVDKNDKFRTLTIKSEELFNKTIQINDTLPDKENAEKIFNSIDWSDIIDVIYHELTHRYDDIKYDFKKIHSLDQNTYIKGYYQDNIEYNAFFLSAINYMKDDIQKVQYTIPNRFIDFKADFEDYIGKVNKHFFIKSEKFRKHINKRIYDLWIKIKERGIKTI